MATKEEKLQAFRLFDFEKSDEYKAYMRNVELPPGDRAMLKAKAKWYKRCVDSEFELDWLPELVTSQPAATGTPQAAPPQPPPQRQHQQQQQQQQQAAAPGRASAQGTPAGRSPEWAAGRRFNLCVLQAMIIVFSVVYLQPISPRWSMWAFHKLLLVLPVSQGLKLHTAQGLPQAWTLAGLKQWLDRVQHTSDLQLFLLALLALVAGGSQPQLALLPPFVIPAVYFLAAFLSEVLANHPMWQKYGAPLYRKLQAKQQMANVIAAQFEVTLGFSLLFGLLMPGRAIAYTFSVWNLLRMRYWSSDAAFYHRQVWAALDQLTANFRQRFPILQKPVDLGVAFFNQGR